MGPFDPIEIMLDKPRLLKPNHRALRIAESELNRQRRATPLTACAIDFALVVSYNTGIYPRDLQAALLLGFLSTDDPKLTLDDIDKILDQTEATSAEINDKLWAAFSAVAGKNIKTAQPGDDDPEKKTDGPDPLTGSSSGPAASTTLN